jgi:hypothetical protein
MTFDQHAVADAQDSGQHDTHDDPGEHGRSLW